MITAMTARDRAKRTMLRMLCLIAAALAVALFGLGWLPGTEVYRDIHGCSMTLEGAPWPSAACTPHYELLGVRDVVASRGWLVALLIAMLAPGAFVWWRPRLRFALLWSLISTGVAVFGLVLSFQPGGWDLRLVELWPMRAFDVLLFALLLLQIALVPIACGAFVVIAHDRTPPRPERIARARIHRERRR